MPRRTLRSERSNRGGSSVVVMQSGGGSSTNFPGSAIDLNFSNGQYFGVTGSPTTFLTTTRASNKTNLFPTSASGFAYSTFSSNIPAITSGSGLSVEESRTNVLLNSSVPATQTTASLGTGTYTLWVNGSGSATSSAGTATITGAGAATNGTPNVFVVTGAGTVTITVGGSLNAFQCELNPGTVSAPTSFIVTAGATVIRAADAITLTSPPAFGAAYSFFAQGTPQAPISFASGQTFIGVDDGTGNNRVTLYRNQTTGIPQWNVVVVTVAVNAGLNIGASAWAQFASGKVAVALINADQAAVFNGGTPVTTATTVPVLNTVRLGSNFFGGYVNGFVGRIAIFPTRISQSQLQAITT